MGRPVKVWVPGTGPLTTGRPRCVLPGTCRMNTANGMALGMDGRLVVCEQRSHSEHAGIAAIDPTTGDREVVVDTWGGLRFQLTQ